MQYSFDNRIIERCTSFGTMYKKQIVTFCTLFGTAYLYKCYGNAIIVKKNIYYEKKNNHKKLEKLRNDRIHKTLNKMYSYGLTEMGIYKGYNRKVLKQFSPNLQQHCRYYKSGESCYLHVCKLFDDVHEKVFHSVSFVEDQLKINYNKRLNWDEYCEITNGSIIELQNELKLTNIKESPIGTHEIFNDNLLQITYEDDAMTINWLLNDSQIKQWCTTNDLLVSLFIGLFNNYAFEINFKDENVKNGYLKRVQKLRNKQLNVYNFV